MTLTDIASGMGGNRNKSDFFFGDTDYEQTGYNDYDVMPNMDNEQAWFTFVMFFKKSLNFKKYVGKKDERRIVVWYMPKFWIFKNFLTNFRIPLMSYLISPCYF